MGNSEHQLISADELTKRINKWYASQERKRARALKAEAIFIKLIDKIFWFLKEKK